jgi:putative lipoprotein
MTPRIAMLSTALLMALVGACHNTTREEGEDLENIHWRLVDIKGTPAIGDSNAREAFIFFNPEDSSAAGSSGCNSFGGTYQRSLDRLAISRVISTKMACIAEGVMEQESAFFNALGAVAAWRRSGERLELLDGAGSVVARFVAVARDTQSGPRRNIR